MTEYNNFFWVCWFLTKNVSNFVSLPWKLDILPCTMKILLCRKVCSNFSLKWWSKGTFWKLSNCTGDRLRQHHMKTHPKIEKYLYNCKICTEYPPTISFMAIMEHYKKVKFVKKWVMKSPKLLFAFADISHKSLPKIWKFWLDSEKQWWIQVKMVINVKKKSHPIPNFLPIGLVRTSMTLKNCIYSFLT